MPDALTVVSQQRWRAEEISTVADVRADLGLDTRAAGTGRALWCPGAWATAATATHPNLRLSSAGPAWLDTVPVEVKGRDTATCTARELAAILAVAGADRVFAKLPETKHERFEASSRPIDELLTALCGIPDDEPVTVQTPVAFVDELRFWVLRGEVVAGASYFADVPREDWPRHEDRRRRNLAGGWLSTVVGRGEVEVPPAVVIDVGWCRNPVTGDPGWRIVEANAAWSSDWYNADDLGAVVETIVTSQRGVPDRWLWRPSPLLVRSSLGLRRR